MPITLFKMTIHYKTPAQYHIKEVHTLQKNLTTALKKEQKQKGSLSLLSDILSVKYFFQIPGSWLLTCKLVFIKHVHVNNCNGERIWNGSNLHKLCAEESSSLSQFNTHLMQSEMAVTKLRLPVFTEINISHDYTTSSFNSLGPHLSHSAMTLETQ